MKRVILIILLGCICFYADAQTDLDSLFYSGFDREQIESAGNNRDSLRQAYPVMAKRTHAIYYLGRTDTAVTPSIKYFHTSEGDHGWYQTEETVLMLYIIGTRPMLPRSRLRTRLGSDYVSTEIFGCLNHGVPHFQWRYLIGWHNGVGSSPIATKIEIYDSGKLHGEFIIRSKGREIYKTVFNRGTGDYMDVFPDGAVRSQGRIEDSRLHGIWYYYARRRETGYQYRIVAGYDMGRELYWKYEKYKNGEWIPKKRLPKELRFSRNDKEEDIEIR